MMDLKAILDLTGHLKRKPYHVVHTHNSKAGFIGRLSAKLARVPVIVHTVMALLSTSKNLPGVGFFFGTSNAWPLTGVTK